MGWRGWNKLIGDATPPGGAGRWIKELDCIPLWTADCREKEWVVQVAERIAKHVGVFIAWWMQLEIGAFDRARGFGIIPSPSHVTKRNVGRWPDHPDAASWQTRLFPVIPEDEKDVGHAIKGSHRFGLLGGLGNPASWQDAVESRSVDGIPEVSGFDVRSVREIGPLFSPPSMEASEEANQDLTP